MKRRKYLQFVGFAAKAADTPLRAEADETKQRRRVAVLMSTAETIHPK